MAGNVDEQQAAEHVIMQSVRGLYFLAGTALVFGFLGTLFVINGVLSAILGFWLGRSRSRLAAATILLIGVVSACVALVNFVWFSNRGVRGGGLIGSALFIWLGQRSLAAATKLASSKETQYRVEGMTK
jgi:hypothetical protein